MIIDPCSVASPADHTRHTHLMTTLTQTSNGKSRCGQHRNYIMGCHNIGADGCEEGPSEAEIPNLDPATPEERYRPPAFLQGIILLC